MKVPIMTMVLEARREGARQARREERRRVIQRDCKMGKDVNGRNSDSGGSEEEEAMEAMEEAMAAGVGGKVEGKVEVEAAGGGEGVGEETRKTRKEETRKKEQRKKEKRMGRRNTGAVRGSLAGSEGDTLVLEDIACGFGYLVVYVRPS